MLSATFPVVFPRPRRPIPAALTPAPSVPPSAKPPIAPALSPIATCASEAGADSAAPTAPARPMFISPRASGEAAVAAGIAAEARRPAAYPGRSPREATARWFWLIAPGSAPAAPRRNASPLLIGVFSVFTSPARAFTGKAARSFNPAPNAPMSCIGFPLDFERLGKIASCQVGTLLAGRAVPFGRAETFQSSGGRRLAGAEGSASTPQSAPRSSPLISASKWFRPTRRLRRSRSSRRQPSVL